MNPPRVSIVIPAYNEGAHIARTLRAAQAQTYPNCEIIVVNNNSTDDTAQQVRAFPHVQLVDESSQGILFARERGRRVATGDFIASLDADCLPRPTWIADALEHLNDPAVVAVSGPYDLYDASPTMRLPHLYSQKVFLPIMTRVAYRLFGRGVIAMGGNTIARASALEAIGGYDTSIKFYGEDMDTANRLARVGRVLYYGRLTMPTSARRYLKHGMARIQGKYFLNFFSIIFQGKPYRNEFGEQL